MTNDLGVWKAEDCALVLIDFQNEMFEVIRSETDADLVEPRRSRVTPTPSTGCPTSRAPSR